MYNLEYFTKENFINKLDTAIQIRYGNEKNDTDGKQKRAFYEDFRRKYPDVFDISQAVRSWRSFSKNNIVIDKRIHIWYTEKNAFGGYYADNWQKRTYKI